MTRLKANNVMEDSLARKQLLGAVDGLRAILSGERYQRATPIHRALVKAEEVAIGGSLPDGREAVAWIELAIHAWDEAAEVQAGLRETERLSAARGVETERAESGATTRDGFQWLIRKGRVNGTRRTAGNEYGKVYARSRADGVRSCLNDERGQGAGIMDPAEMRADAYRAVVDVQRHIHRAVGDAQGERMVKLLNDVCGEGLTLRELARGNDRDAGVLEADLMTALDMVSVRLGLVRAAA